MRSVALDVHRDFCEVAIKDESGLRLAGRVRTSLEGLELFAQSLAPDDQVALEATGPALQIARILEGHVGRVLVANTRKLRAIAEAKVKTDKLDASTLCELLAAGHRYYETVRPCAPHRHSTPRSSRCLGISRARPAAGQNSATGRIALSGRQVPTFH